LVQKLRIALVAACPFPLARGTPVRILRMAEALADRGHDVHVVTYHLGEGEVRPGVKVHRIADVPSYRKLNPGPSYRKLVQIDPLLQRLLRKVLQEQRFDVIHAHHYEGIMVARAARRGMAIPTVYDAHTMLMSELPFYKMGLPSGLLRWIGKVLDGWVPRLADHTVCVTDVIRDRLVGTIGMSASQVSVVTNGVEVDHFDPQKVSRSAPRPGKRIIFTGNLAAYQGIDLMLRAFAKVVVDRPDVQLQIATDSSFGPYEALAAALGIRQRIELVQSPTLDQLPALLVAADVAVNPRVECDGIPVKLLNYMAAGCAIVSFDSSAPGVVHGQTGWLASAGNIDELATGLRTVLDDPALASRLGTSARQYVVENVSWDLVAERCESVYRSLIEARA
jgi:glycosyltransferase involved in cell wall biosynthesis